jgi:hypothetical protein
VLFCTGSLLDVYIISQDLYTCSTAEAFLQVFLFAMQHWKVCNETTEKSLGLRVNDMYAHVSEITVGVVRG